MKKLFWALEDLGWNFKCRYNYWLHGPYGLTRNIERMPLRYLLKYMRKYGATIGTGVIIDSGIKIHRPDKYLPLKNLIIGDNVYIGHRVLLDLTCKIVFENNTAMSADCQIWTHVGDYMNNLKDHSDYKEKTKQVVIREGVVCYSNVILNPGVEICEKSRVLAMSMVSNRIPPMQIWAGVPAKLVKERNEQPLQGTVFSI
jgi:acetyltransferase-like isoleucine patch superfamily enzyme